MRCCVTRRRSLEPDQILRLVIRPDPWFYKKKCLTWLDLSMTRYRSTKFENQNSDLLVAPRAPSQPGSGRTKHRLKPTRSASIRSEVISVDVVTVEHRARRCISHPCTWRVGVGPCTWWTMHVEYSMRWIPCYSCWLISEYIVTYVCLNLDFSKEKSDNYFIGSIVQRPVRWLAVQIWSLGGSIDHAERPESEKRFERPRARSKLHR